MLSIFSAVSLVFKALICLLGSICVCVFVKSHFGVTGFVLSGLGVLLDGKVSNLGVLLDGKVSELGVWFDGKVSDLSVWLDGKVWHCVNYI